MDTPELLTKHIVNTGERFTKIKDQIDEIKEEQFDTCHEVHTLMKRVRRLEDEMDDAYSRALFAERMIRAWFIYFKGEPTDLDEILSAERRRVIEMRKGKTL